MKRGNEVYRYDGTWRGFLCCVFHSFERREYPVGITGAEAGQQSLYPPAVIQSDADRARRVSRWLRQALGAEVDELVREGFLTALPDREMHLLRLLWLARKMGPMAAQARADPSVAALQAAVYSLREEAHLLTGFVRFVEHEGVLTSVISPKHYVLHRLGAHFSDRFSGERIVIYDDTRRLALWCQGGRWGIVRAEVRFPPPGAGEEEWRRLWKGFYKAVAVEGRENPICRMTHMPKRFWKHMTEMEGELPAALRACPAPEGRSLPAFRDGENG